MFLTENQEMFMYWVRERESIRLLKEAGSQKPWTDNKVMQSVYFCNVDREDDKVTKWIRENWYYDYCPEHYVFAMIVARIFNLPETLEEIGQPDGFHWIDTAYEILKYRKDLGKKIWNGAYIVSTNGKKIDKLTYCIQMFKKMLSEGIPRPKTTTTLEDFHKELMGIEGLASFLAAQVIADLKNSEGCPLSHAQDWDTFSSHGPGSLRGLSWFFEEKVTAKNYDTYIKEAFELILLNSDLVDGFLKENGVVLCMQNLQNCFCEYDKFMRVTNATGKSKRNYPGDK